VTAAPPGPVPGFPFESILAGLVAGAVALFVMRRRRHGDMRC
jgi:MYXO-CTERM domain-containing protein